VFSDMQDERDEKQRKEKGKRENDEECDEEPEGNGLARGATGKWTGKGETIKEKRRWKGGEETVGERDGDLNQKARPTVECTSGDRTKKQLLRNHIDAQDKPTE
jgi:hypothetical protein